MKTTMLSKFVETVIRAAIVTLFTGVFYSAAGWIGVAVIALIQLNEISDKLDKLAERSQ
jgi:hypothetical protein